MFKNISKSLIYVISTIVIIGVVFGVTSFATIKAANEPAIIGKVDTNEVQNDYQAYKTAIDNINKEYNRLMAELESRAKSLSQNDLQKLIETYETNLAIYAEKQLSAPRKAFENAIEAVAKEKGVNVVLDNSENVVVFGGIDITAAVKTKLGIK